VRSSWLHLDVLRDLKRIHSHLCSFAYPVLERAWRIAADAVKAQVGEPSDVIGLGHQSH